MSEDTRILIVEDSPEDRELLELELRKGGIVYQSVCVETRPDFERALQEFAPAIVVSDYNLPTFDGLSALRITREKAPDLPFIFVSGSIGEETAVGALKEGATDYLLKGHIKRLCPAIQRALKEARDLDEKRKLEAQFLQAQKMEAVGQLAGGIAHDFNNLLTAIGGYSDLVLARLPPDSPLRKHVEEIRKAGQRASALTRQLLAFSRRQLLAPRVVDLNHYVRDMDDLLRRLIGEEIDLACTLAPALGRVKIDPSQIEQVVMNLVVNARDAIVGVGKVTIESYNVDIQEDSRRPQKDVTPGRWVVLAVSDTGSGMEEETKRHIFEPFFTTKGPGKGTGLGLSTVYGIVKQSGGHIQVYSEKGRGTTFRIYLPRVEGEVEAVPSDASRPTGSRREETILVAEDDDAVRGFIQLVLEGEGYEVLLALSGTAALEISERREGVIDLLLTDTVMPGMSGPELGKRIAAARPTTKVLYLSGYAPSAIVEDGVLEADAPFLQKPFAPAELIRRIRSLLDAPPPAPPSS